MPTNAHDVEQHDAELCLVGAGYAALNALNAAAKYLRPGDRVVVLDKNLDWGGQWLHQYDFLRLHQPYRMFTAGDQPWKLDRPPEHLASRSEVLDHLRTVPAVSAGHLEVVTKFGTAYERHGVQGDRVVVEARPLDPTRPTIRVRARRMIHATGTDIHTLPPLRLSSDRVRSLGVADPALGTRELLEGSAPIYVVGSGKTAMDLVLHLARSGVTKERIRILIGSGMWFFSRDNGYPRGIERHYRGTLAADSFLRMGTLFDGTNERVVMEQLAREGIALNVFGDAANCRYGLLSESERADVLAAVGEVHRGHLVDVEGTRMTVREKAGLREVEVPEGSVFVNCTTHFRSFPHSPVLSDGGLVMSPQYGLGFTGTTAYYLTHLFYRDDLAPIADKLFRVPIDTGPKFRFGPAIGLMVLGNLGLVSPRLPFSVHSRFLGDFNKWYPPHRQLITMVRVLHRQAEMIAKAERLLPWKFSDAVAATTTRVASGAAAA